MSTDQFQHFQIESKLGSGGMGEVYQALDQKLDRRVALKILPKELGQDANRRARFLQEAKTASALNHPNVCVIYEIGESDEQQPYIAMELIEGQSLSSVINGTALPLDVVVTLGIQVADALEAAHAVNIIHRDIKSSNIMINLRQQAKVLDFGLAKRLYTDESSSPDGLNQTSAGQVIGTPNYMSPEQALGKPVDYRSDLFSLGVVLYEMATGHLPFRGDSLGETMDQIIHSTPRAPTRYNPEISSALERIILQCLRKAPDQRFQLASELRQALEEHRNNNFSGDKQSALEISQTQVFSPPAAEGTLSNLSADNIRDTDVLISCAELDDQPMSVGAEGWVQRLKRNLKVKVEQLTGDVVKVESAPLPPGSTEVEDTIYDSISTARTLVSIVSPPFIKSQACNQSVEQYCEAIENAPGGSPVLNSRLFKVLRTPVGEADIPSDLSSKFKQLPSFDFYEFDTDTGRIREFDDSYGDDISQKYYERVYDLAYEVCQGLRQQQAMLDSAISNGGSVTNQSIKTVFLAETTSDLREERDRLRRELLEQGHRVLPDQSLPQVAGELESVLNGYLQQCNFAIHLIGNRYGLVPEDAAVSSVVLQNQTAAEYSERTQLPRIIWMPRDIAPTDDRQVEFIQSLVQDPEAQRGADVIRDTLENLKQLLGERWRKEAERAKQGVSGSDSQILDDVSRLYIIHDRDDEQAIESLEDYFYDAGIEVILPEFEGKESDVSAVHIQNLQDCDGVLVYYGSCAKSWVDIKLRELTKAVGYRDGRPIELRAVYIAPPEDRRKERFKTLSAEVIRQSGNDLAAGELQTLAARIKELKAEKP